MKLISLLTILYSFCALSSESYLYYKGDKQDVVNELIQLDSEVMASDVYSPKEQELLQNTSVHHKVLRVSTKLSLETLRTHFAQFHLEPVQVLARSTDSKAYDPDFGSISNNYEKYQWYLNNTGGSISYWTSDIDRAQIQAQIGEDIQIQGIEEKDKDILVAVIDSGVDVNHPDLKNKIAKKPTECKAYADYQACLSSDEKRKSCHEQYASLDTDNNGYPLDCHGWSFTEKSLPTVTGVTGSPQFTDKDGHGTHVAGLIAAEKNSFGITGIIDHVKILPIQISLFSSAETAIEKMAKGVLYAIENKADVINMSLGWRTQFDSKMMREMVALAIEKGILVVVAGGNSSHSDISYPCAYPDVICVGSHNQAGMTSSFSNTGGQIDLSAPGDRILSTWPTEKRSKQFTEDDNYEYMSGTSQSTPLVAGALAKLLNQGFSASEARVKLLKGTRAKREESQIRHGNLDVTKAIKTDYTSFIFPLNKTPYLIRWSENSRHRFILKLKNYGKDISNAKIKISPLNPDQTVETQNLTIEKLAHDEILEEEIYFIDTDTIESELMFKIDIESVDEKKSYIIKAHYIRLIDNKSTESDISSYKIQNSLEKNAILRPFENITVDGEVDFFVNHKKGRREFVSILKYTEDGYIRSRPMPIRDKMPVYLNFSKVDIDGDHKDDYVIMYVYIDKEKNKISKFLIFDHNLRPKRYLISPKNEFPNDKTFIPGKFKWLKLNGKMIPAWIGFGDPGVDHHASPWSFSTAIRGNYFYYLTPQGLNNFKLPKDDLVLNSFYQSREQQKKGEVDFITTREMGFVKTYRHYTFKNGPEFQSELMISNFFDIMELRSLPTSTDIPSAFYHEESINGDQNIFKLSIEDGFVYDEFIRLNNTVIKESIKFVHLVKDEFIFYQSNHKILVYDRFNNSVAMRESKVDTRRRRYRTFINSQTMYLPSAEAPGMTSELLRLDFKGSFVSDSRYRTLAVNGCNEFGTLEKNQADYIGYVCKHDNSILLLKVQ